MNLNRKHFAEHFRADYKTVAVTFDSSSTRRYGQQAVAYGQAQHQALAQTFGEVLPVGKHYIYKVLKTLDVKIGEKLVVYVTGNENPLQVVTIREVHENPEINSAASFNYKWIVGRLSDVMMGFYETTNKDAQLKLAVEKLEVALTRVSLKKQLAAAMTELDAETIAELSTAFGQDFTQMAIEAK